MITNFQVNDIHKSFLLVGIGARKKYYMEIVRPESSEEAHDAFGECDLTDSFDILFDGHEDADIFVMNVGSLHDFLDASMLLQNYNFSYVVPVDIGISSSFADPLVETQQQTYYLQYFIRKSRLSDDTVVLATDNHASLYEDIDAFLDDMNEKLQGFKANTGTNDIRKNIVFVMNNVAGVPYANVVLARMILNSEANEYPYEDRNRRAVFDIDTTDKISDMAYFKSHADGSFTVENLLNLYPLESPLKIFTAWRICCYVGRNLSFEDFVGSAYTMYKKQQIASEVESYLGKIVGDLITAYKIDDVYAEEDFLHPGTVNVVVKYSIKPVGSSERFIQRTVIA